MDEVEREDGPDQLAAGQDEPAARPDEPQPPETAPPGARQAEPVPTLLQELAALGPTDELGTAVAEEPSDDDDAAQVRPRVRTSTKIVVVAAAWLLLTLFLVGRFSSGAPDRESSTRLDQASAGDEEEAEAEDGKATGDAEAGDASAGEAAEREYADGAAVYGDGTDAGTGAVAGVAGGGDIYAGVPADGTGGVAGGGASPATVPAAPGRETAPAPDGGSAATAPPSGGGATTTTPGGGGGAATTTTSSPASGAAPVDRTITISGNGQFAYDPPSLSVPSGSRVRMANDSNANHTWQIENDTPIPVPKNGPPTDYRTFTSTVTFKCSIHKNMSGTITIT